MAEWDVNADPEQIKDVYAHFGLAMYHAQCLEQQLILILATKYGPGPTKLSNIEFENVLDTLSLRTLGHLVNEIGKLASLSEDEKGRLQKALTKRNWLAHRYFSDRSIDFLSESGREIMVEELQEVSEFFHSLAESFTQRTMEYVETLGITQELIDLGVCLRKNVLNDNRLHES